MVMEPNRPREFGRRPGCECCAPERAGPSWEHYQLKGLSGIVWAVLMLYTTLVHVPVHSLLCFGR